MRKAVFDPAIGSWTRRVSQAGVHARRPLCRGPRRGALSCSALTAPGVAVPGGHVRSHGKPGPCEMRPAAPVAALAPPSLQVAF